MLKPIVKSLLKENIDKLPEGSTYASEAVAPMLVKKGVKQEELDYAAMNLPEGRVSKEQLQAAEAGRSDFWTVKEPNPQYARVAPEGMANNPTYRERVYQLSTAGDPSQFSDAGALIASRFTASAHFPSVPNYLMHARGVDDTFEGFESRIVYEIQSDLHQAASQTAKEHKKVTGEAHPTRGYESFDLGDRRESIKAVIEEFDAGIATVSRTDDRGQNDLVDTFQENLVELFPDKEEEIYNMDVWPGMTTDDIAGILELGNVPKSPLEKQWLRKGLEQELVLAMEEGRTQLVIPIAGVGTKQLHRSKGVQKWYETQVVNTMKKLAKQTGSHFEMVTPSPNQLPASLSRLDKAEVQGLIGHIDFNTISATQTRELLSLLPDDIAEHIYDRTSLGMPSSEIIRELYRDTPPTQADARRYLNTFMEHGYADSTTELRRELGITTELQSLMFDNVRDLDMPIRVAVNSALDELYPQVDANTFAVIRPQRNYVEDPEVFADKFGDLIAQHRELSSIVTEEMEPKLKASLDAENAQIQKDLQELEGGKAKLPDFTMYSTPVGGAFVAYKAYQAGMSEEQVHEQLRAHKFDAEDIAEIDRRVNVIRQGVAAGKTEEELRTMMEGREPKANLQSSEPAKIDFKGSVDKDIIKGGGYAYNMSEEGAAFSNYQTNPATGTSMFGGYDISKLKDPKVAAYDTLVDPNSAMTPQELVSNMRVLYPTMVSDAYTTIPGWFGNQEAKQRYDHARESSRERMKVLAKEYGLDLVWSKDDPVAGSRFLVATEQGNVDITPGLWEDLKKSSGEIAGGVAGGIMGAKTAAAAAPPVAPIIGPFSKPAAGFLGGMAGGAVGAMVGSQIDYLSSAIKLQEEMEAQAIAYRSLNAMEAGVIGDTVAWPALKMLGFGWRGIKNAKDLVMGGNPKGAYEAIKDITFLDDAQADEIVRQFERHSQLEGTPIEKRIQAITLSQPGMQNLVEAAGSLHPKASSTVSNYVLTRGEDVLARTADLSDEQVPRMLVQDLQNYVLDTKDAYATVKAQATQTKNAQNFDFDFEELAIQPVLDSLSSKITDPTVKARFLLQMERINNMSESRTFGDLIELRQTVNDFLFNKRIVKADDQATLRTVVDEIDEAIRSGAGSVVENPEKWLKDWATVRADYSRMKGVEKTAMYRAMFDKNGKVRPIQPATVVKALGKYITSLDGSFEEVMAMMPTKSRQLYEGAVVDALAQRFTDGADSGMRATHFPLLADELSKISLTTPDARAAKTALMEMAEVFKNDVFLARSSGQINIPKFQSFLTADPVVRAKFEVASGVFNFVKSKFPGDANKKLALVRMTAKLLDKPLDNKLLNDVMAEVYDDVNMTKAIQDMQQAVAKDRMKQLDVGTPKVRIYKNGKFTGTGNFNTVPQHRILTIAQAKEIAEANALTLDSKSLDAVLKQHGYLAIMQGTDRVRMLGD